MANFRTHISFGALLGTALVIAGLIYSFFSSTEVMIWIFLAVLIGSFLPDLDMDEGIPFQILFGLFGVGIGGLAFFILYENEVRDSVILILTPVVAFMGMRFGIGYIFEKLTDHRGIFHSIPAAILFGLLTVWLLNFFSIFISQKLILGLAITVGYLGHLVLDEIYSSVNLNGRSLLPKQSLGSALKLYSSSKIATFIFYALIFIFAMKIPEIKDFLEGLY